MITGTCVSPGEVKGRVRFFKEGVVYTNADIVILESWLAQDILALKGAGALLSTKGSLTAHASILSREFGIPALVKVDVSSLQEGDEVFVDTAEELVEKK
tara:strand:+ start:3100 stop:3399 length:300 start_codon:yes stop_codon:yes gene_type:complete